MPHRRNLLTLLESYKPNNTTENEDKIKTINFITNNHDCFLRENIKGHITGSAWLLSPDKKFALLTLHKKMELWLQLGGHADGDNNILDVALKEAQEESGISGIVPILHDIFDLGVHLIPESKHAPAHFHYDIRFILIAPHKNFLISPESIDLKWYKLDELSNGIFSETITRMAQKSLSI